MKIHKFPYKWTLKDANFTKDKGKVFSCFACGGGSTMGYKLAGFDVIGCNEIDKRMMDVYIANHNPKYSYLEPIQDFKNRDDLPKELYDLDILDGSPPCSSFSVCGNREKDWGVNKKFKEGQTKQILDTLFFDFIDLAKELQPKIIVTENVKGILMGDAIKYVRAIYMAFDDAGYYCQHFLLNSKYMGVPQRRNRVFFICIRKDLACDFLEYISLFDNVPKIDMTFNEPIINFGEVQTTDCDRPLTEHYQEYWNLKRDGDMDFSCSSIRLGRNPNANFNRKYIYSNKVANTICAGDVNILFDQARCMNKEELISCGAFPKDYDFLTMKPEYIIGMSVPPLMIANIATNIYEQWLSKL